MNVATFACIADEAFIVGTDDVLEEWPGASLGSWPRKGFQQMIEHVAKRFGGEA